MTCANSACKAARMSRVPHRNTSLTWDDNAPEKKITGMREPPISATGRVLRVFRGARILTIT